MSFVIGYSGLPYLGPVASPLPMMPPPAPGHPLASVATLPVQLYSDEVDAALAGTGMQWHELSVQQQQAVAITILQARGDLNSERQAQALSLNNPSFNGAMQILVSPPTTQAHPLASFLLS